MKVAFLFSGQLRNINYNLFQKSLDNLTSGLDYDIYSYSWEEKGKSLNHQSKLSKLENLENINEYINKMFQGFNLFNYDYESYKNFTLNLEEKYIKILNSKEYHFGTINVIPQIYTLYKCYKLLENKIENYDLIFRCRFDSVFIHPLKFYSLNTIYFSNNLYNLNFGRAYYPQRIYDIFFGGSKKSMKFISTLWKDLPNLIENKFDNGLDKRDCCRILYLAANSSGIDVKSFNTRICDVYRNNGHSYEKYLISSHIIKFNKNYLFYLKLVFKWFKYRDFSKYRVIYCFLIFLLLFPFSYLKRLKFLF